MGKIEKIIKKGPVEGQTTEVYPVTSTKAVYDENNKRLDNIITGLQESVYLNTPIPISTDNTTESMAQNVKNIADYVEKAKAAGIADVNGMAVTCLIDEDYSAVGYLYGITFIGITLYDDNRLFYVYIGEDGTYNKDAIITKNETNQVTSSMLVQGARKPIIFTLETTEVDEETYQKLFPDGVITDNVDIMFRIGGFDTSEFIPCISSAIYDAEGYMELYFAGISCGGTLQSTFLIGYYVTIGTGAPHQCEVTQLQYKSLNDILSDAGYLNKSALNPVLQEIDLTGTDADRKAKLDKFEADWKALTGADDLNGARFVGYCEPPFDGVCIFSFNSSNGIYTSILIDSSLRNYQVSIELNGSLTITPLFSHLEAITIQTLNIPANKKKNSDAIQAYVNNLAGIGVDVTKGYIIPIKTVGFENGVGVIYPNTPVDKSYKGICIANGHSYIITISQDGTWDKRDLLDSGSDYTVLNTSAKEILSAINEINTLAKNKQDKLTSGTNIKTINNQSLLGSGNIEISAPSITVDTTISDTSMNPVQNKVIKAYIDGLVGNVAAQLAQI